MRRLSFPSFLAGAACATVLAVVPAYAVVTANDQKPSTFDGTTPALTVQPAQFVIGQSIDDADLSGDFTGFNHSIPMRLSWDATDTISGTKSFDIASENIASYLPRIDFSETGATSLSIVGTNYDDCCGGGFGNTYRWITARDHRGNTATSSKIINRVDVWDQNGVDPTQTAPGALAVARTGTWSTSTCTCHNFGSSTYSSAAGASLTFTIRVDKPGRTVAIVAPKGASRGVMNISVDGGQAQAVNTYATANTNRVIVWQQSLSAGQHTVKITNAGTAGRSRIDVDSIMLGPAWSGEAPPIVPEP